MSNRLLPVVRIPGITLYRSHWLYDVVFFSNFVSIHYFRLHRHNSDKFKESRILEAVVGGPEKCGGHFVTKYGFHKDVCCGSVPLVVEWVDNWLVSYYIA